MESPTLAIGQQWEDGYGDRAVVVDQDKDGMWLVWHSRNNNIVEHHADGTVFMDRESYSLVELWDDRRTVEIDLWLNVYTDGKINVLHNSRRCADAAAFAERIACINIKRKVTAGEGIATGVAVEKAGVRAPDKT